MRFLEWQNSYDLNILWDKLANVSLPDFLLRIFGCFLYMPLPLTVAVGN